ncbi:phosphatidate cytidylyltransferase [Alkalicoccobacillus plakortidis]|uniref:Phosphatidate cytidylyltransferase n=1 Tax=Alkalicoccobacillus plakortidis TaxID=444060 RepID=A0ABT0XFN2_9BACI|nr:phosphatidate cytidylyltransferase [Alkalicoccobacillus plakortidis]MCM2674711.1 phosphatidate cytidylyltransferase [Alkalicoccobacillus plakortidis]
MKQRIITGVGFGIVMIAMIFLGGTVFNLAVSIAASIAMIELLRMKKMRALSLTGITGLISMWILLVPASWFNAVFPFQFTKVELFIFFILIMLMLTVLTKNTFTFDEVGFVVLSSVYVGFGFHYLMLTRETPNIGMALVFFVILLIWTTDSAAYFVGRAIGKNKLWPDISPNKTIEGSLGGVFFALLLGTAFYFLLPDLSVYISFTTAFIIMVVASVFGQIGDLVESALKRHYAVKDSGNVLPGHGGILDRFDSLIFVMPILHLIQLI